MTGDANRQRMGLIDAIASRSPEGPRDRNECCRRLRDKPGHGSGQQIGDRIDAAVLECVDGAADGAGVLERRGHGQAAGESHIGYRTQRVSTGGADGTG